MTFKLHVINDNDSEFLVTQENLRMSRDYYSRDFSCYTRDNSEDYWEKIGKPRDPILRWMTQADSLYSHTIYGNHFTTTEIDHVARSVSVQHEPTSPRSGRYTISTTSGVALETLQTQQEMNRHIRAHATELARREAQREEERIRLEQERNRPSFLRRINLFR